MKWIDKYIKSVKESKLNAVKGSFLFALVLFVIFFLYNKISSGDTNFSIIISLIISIIFFITFFITSLVVVKNNDKTKERIELEKAKEREEKRKKLESKVKVNNKKKKKNR